MKEQSFTKALNYLKKVDYMKEANLIKRREKRELFKTSLFVGIALILSYLSLTVFSSLLTVILSLCGYDYNKILSIFLDDYYGYLINSVSLAISLIFPFLIIKIGVKQSVSEIAHFNSPNKYWFLSIFFALGVAMASNIASGIFNEFLKNFFDFTPVQVEIGDGVYDSDFELLFSLTNIALIPALIEEFAFRGMILGSLKKFGNIPAILISSLIFALYHGNFVQIPFAFLVGISLGMVFVITDSIWPSVIVHFINNAYAVIANAYSEEYGFALFVIYYGLILVGIFSCVFLSKTNGFKRLKSKKTQLSSVSKFFRILLNPTVIVVLAYLFYTSLQQRA